MTTTRTKTLHQLAEQALPVGGPYDVQHTETAALLLPQLVGYLAHATFDDRDAAQALPYPSTTTSVIAAVKMTAQRLQQLLNQLAERTEVHGADPALRAYDVSTTPAVHAGVLAADLRDAAQAADNLAGRLDRAHNDAGRLSLPWTDEDDD